MTQRPTSDRVLTRYLLGELAADEEAALDERAFVDDAWDEERAVAADDLIDAYLSGGLTTDQRRRFETHFLASSDHRERFRLMRDLRTVIDRGRSGAPARRALRTLLWAVAAALVAAMAALFAYSRRTQGVDPRLVVGPTPAPTVAPTASSTPSPRATPTAAPGTTPPSRVETVSLPERPGAVEIALASGVRVVRFSVAVPEHGPPSYAATIRHDGRAVWKQEDLVPEAAGAPLVVNVPADVLEGDSTVLSIEPEALRSVPPRPGLAERAWPLRVVRR